MRIISIHQDTLPYAYQAERSTEEDLEAVSSLLTPNLDEQWMDDVTIIVQVL